MHDRMGWFALALAGGFALLASPAPAQNVIFDAPGFMPQKNRDRLPEVKAAPQAWPRLDPGAALCRSEGDLDRLTARRRGEADGPADCRIVNTPTAVTILQRRGAGRTEVRITDAETVTGWTDVWLPEKAPASAGVRPTASQ